MYAFMSLADSSRNKLVEARQKEQNHFQTKHITNLIGKSEAIKTKAI